MESDTSESGNVVFRCPEWQVTSFDVDSTSRLAALVVQKWLAIVDLNSPSGTEFGSSGEGRQKAKKKLGTQNKYEVKAVGWNPHTSTQQILASTSQQKLNIWDINESKQPLVSIKAHTRSISDLCWSGFDPNLIATCAVDSYVHIWDIRDSRKPKVSFRNLGGLSSGASLVQWNRFNSSILASAHDSDVRIWDMKKPSTVSACISAHLNKIHGIDWSYRNETSLTTCSHDATVKFWDVQSPREPVNTIKTGTHPVWRAKNYPLGNGIAMALVPTMHSKENRVFVWSRTNVTRPVGIFSGHTEPVTELHWRRHRGECQLATISKDHSLRLWCLEEQLQQDLETEHLESSYISIESPQIKPEGATFAVGGDEEVSSSSIKNNSPANPPQDLVQATASSPLTGTRPHPYSEPTLASSPSLTSLSSNSSPGLFPSHSHTLNQEFSLMNMDIPNLEVESLEASQRSCTVKMELGGHLVRMHIGFPAHYPNGAAPSFNLHPSTTIDIGNQQELVRVVSDTAYINVRANRPCLEQCLRKLAKSFESQLVRPKPPPVQPDLHLPSSLEDEHIPFPRTSGVSFCPNGQFVCFICPNKLLQSDETTPKSLDKLQEYRSMKLLKGLRTRPTKFGSLPKRSSATDITSSPILFRDRTDSIDSQLKAHSSSQGSRKSEPLLSAFNVVSIFDASSLLPINYELAKAYSLVDTDITELCSTNASIAAAHGRADLVQTWSISALIAATSIEVPAHPDKGSPWPLHPFGRQLLKSLFEHYRKQHDVQTLAMLAYTFQLQSDQVDSQLDSLKPAVDSPTRRNHSHTSMYHSLPSTPSTPHPQIKRLTPVGDGHLMATTSFITPEKGIEIDAGYSEEIEMNQRHHDNCRLLDESFSLQYNEYRRCYSNILYCWGLPMQRAEVLKCKSKLSSVPRKETVFTTQCGRCYTVLTGPVCPLCRVFVLTCSVCNIPVRGCSNLCLSCGHGGHTHHIMDWFSDHTFCPSGCGCQCLEASGWL